MIPTMFGGLQLIIDPCMPQSKEAHRQERKWAHRIMHQRYRRFKIKWEPMIVQFDGKIVCHPLTAKLILKDILGWDLFHKVEAAIAKAKGDPCAPS